MTRAALCLCLCAVYSALFSQELVLDKPFYLAGEVIQYSILQDGKSTKQLIYVELRNHSNEVVDFQKVLYDGQSASGSITIPPDASFGYYRLAIWTDLDRAPIYQQQLPVYSEWMDNEVIQSTPGLAVDSTMLESLHGSYGLRDTAELVYRGGDAHVSMVMIDSELAGRYLPSKRFRIRQTTDSVLLLKGTLTDSKDEPVTSNLISVYATSSKTFHRAVVENGKLRVELPEFYGNQLVQIFNLNPYQEQLPKLTLEQHDLPDYSNQEKPPFYDYVARYLVNHKKIQKINRMYSQDYAAEDLTSSVEFVPDKIYRTADYQQMGSFSEFIDEVVSNARVTKKNPTIKLFNPEVGERFVDHPWFIVDGLMTYDEEFVLGINIKDVEEIRLYVTNSTIFNYFEPFMLRNGVIEIRTRDVKYQRQLREKKNVGELVGLSRPLTPVRYVSANEPLVRSVVQWVPDISLAENVRIKVPLTDNSGKYSILLRGFSNGKPFSTQATIVVQPD